MTQTRPMKPLYAVEQRIGDLVILTIEGHACRGQAVPQWWYTVRCMRCGDVFTLTQKQIRTRVHKMCVPCAKKLKHPPKFEPVERAVPDFATMRLVG